MQPNQVILYVKDINTSIALYSDILKRKPIESHPTYASFQLDSGFSLAFWSIDDIADVAIGLSNAAELIFELPTKQAVNECYKEWQKKLEIIEEPTELCFGYAFLAMDSDQHRLRVYVSNE